MKTMMIKDPIVRNIWYLSLLVFVLSLQVMIIVVFIYQFIPLKMASITQGAPEAMLKLFQPNRNQFFYHVFIASAIIGQALALYFYRKRLAHDDLAGEIQKILVCETVWVSWQLFAVFKILQYDNPFWARILLYAGFTAAFLGKIFWPEIRRIFHPLKDLLKGEIPAYCRPCLDGGIVFLLLSVIMIPDAQKALLRIAFIDNNIHFDQWLLTPLWAYHKNLIPVIQTSNPLNWGVPVLINLLVNFFGGLSYMHVIGVLCFIAVVYYAAFYYLIRTWLGVLPAVFAVLVAVKLQMFNTGISPIIWTYPEQSILRHLFDVAVFACLLLYSRGKGEYFIWLAAAGVGISMAFVFDTGLYMLIAFYAYVAVLMAFKETRGQICPSPRQWRKVLALFLCPWVFMFLVLGLCFGSFICHKEFWINSFSEIPKWVHGQDSISIFSCLKDRNFFAFFASFVLPIIYTAGCIAALSMVYFRRWKSETLFLIPLSVYGLGVYAHFLWHGTINYYYMAPLPLVGCICFLGGQSIKGLPLIQQQAAKIILVVLAGIALFTNYFFTYYPNVFNMAGENWDQEKAYYQDKYNFDHDADFVRQWTPSNERVALISSFETEVLLRADRAPFFYDSFPVISEAYLKGLVNQLDAKKTKQVFIAKNLLSVNGNSTFDILMNYLKAHYQYTGQQSDNLALLKRNDG